MSGSTDDLIQAFADISQATDRVIERVKKTYTDRAKDTSASAKTARDTIANDVLALSLGLTEACGALANVVEQTFEEVGDLQAQMAQLQDVVQKMAMGAQVQAAMQLAQLVAAAKEGDPLSKDMVDMAKALMGDLPPVNSDDKENAASSSTPPDEASKTA